MDPVLRGRTAQDFQVVVAHLVAKPARAAMNHHRDLALEQSHHLGCRLVKDLVHDLYFEEMIAAPERAELARAAFQRAVGDVRRLGLVELSALLNELQIPGFAETVLHRPRSALMDAFAFVGVGQF